MELEDLITITQAAQVKKVSRETLYRAIRNGKLKAYPIGDKMFLRYQDVEAYKIIGHRPKRNLIQI